MDFTNMIMNIITTGNLPVIKTQSGLYETCYICEVDSYLESLNGIVLVFRTFANHMYTISGTVSNNNMIKQWISDNQILR